MVVTSETNVAEPNVTEGAKAKKERKVYKRADKIAFITLVDSSILNAEGKITGVPQGFDPKLHAPPKRDDFVNDADYTEFSSDVWQAKADHATKKAEDLRRIAKELREYGDPQQRKQVLKFQKMVNALKELKGTMAKSGISISLEELLADAE